MVARKHSLWFALTLVLFSGTHAWALPQPNEEGNYLPTTQPHYVWVVVDPDANGLNCRANIPPGGGSDRIVTRFFEGEIIRAVQRIRGVQELVLQGGKTWLRVRFEDRECWVRAHEDYIQPTQ